MRQAGREPVDRSSGKSPASNALYAFTAALSAGTSPRRPPASPARGVWSPPTAPPIHGRAEIAAILAQMIARRTEIEPSSSSSDQAGTSPSPAAA